MNLLLSCLILLIFAKFYNVYIFYVLRRYLTIKSGPTDFTTNTTNKICSRITLPVCKSVYIFICAVGYH